MKQAFLIIASASLIAATAFAETDQDGVINALKSADASELSRFYDDVLDVKLPAKDEIKNIGRNQAGILVKTFFRENSISGFALTSQREMGGTRYITGKLTGGSRTYNITLMMHARGNQNTIISVRIN